MIDTCKFEGDEFSEKTSQRWAANWANPKWEAEWSPSLAPAQSIMMCDCQLRGGAEVVVGHSTWSSYMHRKSLSLWVKKKK